MHNDEKNREIRNALTSEIKELEQYIHEEVNKQKIKSFQDDLEPKVELSELVESKELQVAGKGKENITSCSNTTSEVKNIEPKDIQPITLHLIDVEVTKAEEGERTPTRHQKDHASLMRRLENAPYKKCIIDAPTYSYNSDDNNS